MQPKHFIIYACSCFDTFLFWYLHLQVAALILENTFTSILDMAGVLLPFLRWFIGGSGSKSPKVLNFLVRSPWSTVDVIGQVSMELLELLSLSKASKLRHECF